ncbi:hypothetical protein [uncultured Psychrobacter sp.]|uniref:hypothetical protein n=1 Tax=uncultured Psychrobacter sp. TaxID=259303 RepID=UPI003459E537
MLTTNQTFQGTVAAVVSNFLFSLLFLFGLFMQPLSGTQVASWRVLMMLLSLVFLVSATNVSVGGFCLFLINTNS